jgi:hypothetical protein
LKTMDGIFGLQFFIGKRVLLVFSLSLSLALR